MLGQPALVAGHHRGDPQRVALLAQQGVAAVAGAVRPDHPLLGELDDVLLGVARPLHVLLAGLERGADGVQGGDVLGVLAELLDAAQHVDAGAGHHAHGDHDVLGVGDLDAEHRVLGLDVPHHERDDVHRAALHAAGVEPAHQVLHLVRVHPVVGGPGVLLVHGADEGAVLDPGDVGRVGGGVEAVGLLLLVEAHERAGLDELLGQAGPLGVGAGDPLDVVWGGHRCHLVDPCLQAGVRGAACALVGVRRLGRHVIGRPFRPGV